MQFQIGLKAQVKGIQEKKKRQFNSDHIKKCSCLTIRKKMYFKYILYEIMVRGAYRPLSFPLVAHLELRRTQFLPDVQLSKRCIVLWSLLWGWGGGDGSVNKSCSGAINSVNYSTNFFLIALEVHSRRRNLCIVL